METQIDKSKSKHVIAVYGGQKMGKSGSIKLAFKRLKELYPEDVKVLIDGYDIKVIMCIHGKKVGIESQGDPNSRQMESVSEFEQNGCDIILVASRTRGMTVKSIQKLKPAYIIEWIWKGDYFDSKNQAQTNQKLADVLVEKVEEYAK